MEAESWPFQTFWHNKNVIFFTNMAKQTKLAKIGEFLLFFTEISHFSIATLNFRLGHLRPKYDLLDSFWTNYEKTLKRCKQHQYLKNLDYLYLINFALKTAFQLIVIHHISVDFFASEK